VTDPTLTRRDAEHILDGDSLPGRTDLGGVIELAAFLRTSGALEPPPPMSVALFWQIIAGRGSGATRPQLRGREAGQQALAR
jgi:hypothetical protein